MKKTVSWKGLIAVAAVLAMSAFLFSCTDTNTYNPPPGSSGSSSLKGTIKGLVVDVNNNPIQGATVVLLGNKRLRLRLLGAHHA